MRSRISYLRVGLPIFLLLLLGAASVSAATLADPNTVIKSLDFQELDADSGVICARQSGVEWTAASQAWSQVRMEAAQPYPLPQVEALPTMRNSGLQEEIEPVYLPSIPPENSQPGDGAAEVASFQEMQSVASYDYPAPFTRFENFDNYTSYPYKTIGVLFFSQRGTDYRCSAAVVGENALWTAGHCVHDGSGELEGWSENVVFVPAYKNGSAPYGSWSHYDLCTQESWHSNADLRFDLAGVILEPNLADKSVRSVVGSLGFAYNLSAKQHWFNIAYPTENPFDGTTMQICAGSFARNATSLSFPMPMGMGCDLTPGSSGGPWIISFSGSSGNNNYLNGNNSFRYAGYEDEVYSPYFGDAAKDLLDYISADTKLRTNIHIPFITSSGDQ